MKVVNGIVLVVRRSKCDGINLGGCVSGWASLASGGCAIMCRYKSFFYYIIFGILLCRYYSWLLYSQEKNKEKWINVGWVIVYCSLSVVFDVGY